MDSDHSEEPPQEQETSLSDTVKALGGTFNGAFSQLSKTLSQTVEITGAMNGLLEQLLVSNMHIDCSIGPTDTPDSYTVTVTSRNTSPFDVASVSHTLALATAATATAVPFDDDHSSRAPSPLNSLHHTIDTHRISLKGAPSSTLTPLVLTATLTVLNPTSGKAHHKQATATLSRLAQCTCTASAPQHPHLVEPLYDHHTTSVDAMALRHLFRLSPLNAIQRHLHLHIAHPPSTLSVTFTVLDTDPTRTDAVLVVPLTDDPSAALFAQELSALL